jgi:glycerol kinase
MSLFLALDQSTSATKALLFDAEHRVVDSVSRDHRQIYPQPGWVEHDAEEIWQNTLAAVSELLRRQPAATAALRSLSISNQRETIVVFETGTGRPLAPAIVWQCRRSDALCAEHVRAGAGALVTAKTGLRIDAYFSGSKMQWLVRHRPDLRARLADGSALFGTIDTYLIYRLTGGAVFATDHTNASRTLLFDIERLQWDDELCALWEIPRHALADVRASSDRFGATDFAGLLAAPVPICGVMGDSQASLFAHRCYETGSAKVTFGSGSSVLLNVGPVRPRADRAAVTALAWVLAGVPTYALEGIVTYSGATVAWLRDQLGLISDVAETEALALAVDDDHGVYLVPAFSGLAAPHWCDTARGAIVGLTAHSDRRHLVRAALESISFQVRDALAAMQTASGVKLARLHGDGGATRNRFLMQFTADLTGVELVVAGSPHFSPLGAVMMGAAGMSEHHIIEDSDPAEKTTYRSQKSPAWVQERCAGWNRAVQQTIGNAP